MLYILCSIIYSTDNWIGRLYLRRSNDYEEPSNRHAIALEGNDGRLHVVADLDNLETLEDFPVMLSENPRDEFELENEPIEIIRDGNMLLALRNPPAKRWTVTDKRAPTVTDKRFTVTDKRAPTVTDKRFTVTDKRGYTVTEKRAPTVTDKRFTVTEKRAPTVTDKRFTVTDKRFTVTDKRAPTVTEKRFTVTDKRAPTVTDKRFTVTDKRAPTVTEKRFTVTDKRAPTVTDKRVIKRFLQRLMDNVRSEKRMTVTDKRGTVTDELWDSPNEEDFYQTIVKRDVRDMPYAGITEDDESDGKDMMLVSHES